MAEKKITDLQQIASIDGTESIPCDDAIQTYRATPSQIKDYILANGNIELAMLADSLKELLIPTGSIQAYVAETAPAGWLVCHGAQVSRTTYAALYAVIGNSFGSGDGSTTFHLPDLRGEFLRGWSNGRAGADPNAASRIAQSGGGNSGDNIGSYQGHQLDSHNHASQRIMQGGNLNFGDDAYSVISKHNGSGTVSTAVEVGATGGNETRPRNIYVNYIIKT